MKSALNLKFIFIFLSLLVVVLIFAARPAITYSYFMSQCIDTCSSRGEEFSSGGGDRCDGYCDCFVNMSKSYDWNPHEWQSYQVSNWESFGTVSVWDKILFGKCMI